MKYYSEILESFFDTEEACYKAEEAYNEKQKKEIFEKEKTASEKNLDALYVASQKSLLQFQKDDDAFYEALRKHLKLYGPYVYKTTKGPIEAKISTSGNETNSLFSLARDLGIF